MLLPSDYTLGGEHGSEHRGCGPGDGNVANWISFFLIFFPVLLAALYRIRVEERVLKEAFGDEYDDYSRSTKRLVPGIY